MLKEYGINLDNEKAPTITEVATSDVDANSITQGKGNTEEKLCQ